MSVNDPFMWALANGFVGVWEREGPKLAVEAGEELNMAEPRSMVSRRSRAPRREFVEIGLLLSCLWREKGKRGIDFGGVKFELDKRKKRFDDGW